MPLDSLCSYAQTNFHLFHSHMMRIAIFFFFLDNRPEGNENSN